jgi:hypothetical protein
MHYEQGGGKYPIHASRGSFASREEKLGQMHLFRGSLHSCIWELFFAWIVVVLFCLTLRSRQFWSILSRLCRAVALVLGDRDFFLSSDLFLAFVWLLITCLSFSLFLFFFSSLWIGTCVCCQFTHQGGDWGPECPRTRGWLLLAVMSDWQRGVDWLLAEYCRYRLRLDLRWCRWRVGVKGLCLAGPPRSGETSRPNSRDPWSVPSSEVTKCDTNTSPRRLVTHLLQQVESVFYITATQRAR